jgi:hypothetical protein
VRALQFSREVSGHDVQGGKGFAGVAEEGLRIDVREDSEDVTNGTRLLLIVLAEGRDVFNISVYEGRGVQSDILHLLLLA